MSRTTIQKRKDGRRADVIDWLLEGDPAIRWQAMRDLAGAKKKDWQAEQRRVAGTGWGLRLLRKQDRGGTWGGGIYTPKWTSTTYTLLLLRRMGLPTLLPAAVKACTLLLDEGMYADGGINFSRRHKQSETCITGMVLSMAAWFMPENPRQEDLVRYLMAEQMKDGGWNCQRYRGAVHGSFHTTINVLEGLREYAKAGGKQAGRALEAESKAREFFLRHRLYRSHRTGEVVKPEMARFSFPPRWHHDILRTLDCFQASGAAWDARLEDPLGVLEKRRGKDGRWPLQNRHPGKVFFEMEKVGRPSRWNTLRALRVLEWRQQCRKKIPV